jgi:hypothetical protein
MPYESANLSVVEENDKLDKLQLKPEGATNFAKPAPSRRESFLSQNYSIKRT